MIIVWKIKLDVDIYDGDTLIAHIESTYSRNNKLFRNMLQKLKDEVIPQEKVEAKSKVESFGVLVSDIINF